MYCLRHILLVCSIVLFDSLCLSAKSVRDTLFTQDGDRAIVSYVISRSDNQYNIKFNDSHIKLGRKNSDKYKDSNQLAVMFFDRTGGYDKNVSITNMVPDAFMIPSNVNYQKSSDGFFVIVQDNPTLSFVSNGNSEIVIPMYLAYHPKKGKYKLFGKCNSLKIPISPSFVNTQASSPGKSHQTVTTTDIDADNMAEINVLESIKTARDLLDNEDKLPFSESLQDEIQFLRQQKREIRNEKLISQITDVLNLYEEKKTVLEEKASAEQMTARQEAEAKEKREAEAMQAKNDSIAAAQQAQAEKDKKRNFWLIIGGAILALLAFVGNQVLQSVRNSRNQKRMMDMQQGIAEKAEAEAKRRAQKAARDATNQTVNDAKKIVRKHTRIKVNGKSKNLSI